jgi:hypothetical protein
MAFAMNSIQKGVKRMPRKIVIYGPPKMGKSTLAGATKNALLIPTEDRVAHIDCDKTAVVTKYEEIMDIFDFLLQKKTHTYKRVIIDTLDWLEPIIHAQVCQKKGFASLVDDKNKETNFQKGLKFHAVEGWKTFLYNCDVLRNAGFDIVAVAHSKSVTINPPDTDKYEKSVMKIDENALAVVEEWADIIGFYAQEIFVKKDEKSLQKKGKAITSKKRILHLSGENPAMISGNSYRLGDAEVELENCQAIMEWLLTETNN